MQQEKARPYARTAGQLNFDSGWEWSYWLNSVVTARCNARDPTVPPSWLIAGGGRAVWQPHMELSESQALLRLLEPLTRHLSSDTAKEGTCRAGRSTSNRATQ